MRTLSAISILAFSLTLLGTAAPAEAKGRIRNALRHPVQTVRNAKQAIGERKAQLTQRVQNSRVVRGWQSFGQKHPTAKKWIKRGAIGVGVVAGVAAAPYVLGAAGTILSTGGTVLSTVGGSGVVQGASALAGKAIVGGAGLAAGAVKTGVVFAAKNAIPLAAGAGGAALYGKYKARRAAAATPPSSAGPPVQLSLPGMAAGL